MVEPRVATTLQVLMGSTKFSGKVLKPLARKSVLWNIIRRLRKCRTVDVIAVVTPANTVDDSGVNEHISPYSQVHPELFSQKFTPIRPEHVVHDSHVSIDTEQDLSQ